MWKVLALGVFLAGCAQTVVKPAYIDPEEDLSRDLDRDYQTLESHPTREVVGRILSTAYTYHKRVDLKIRNNNARARSEGIK